MVNRSVVGCQIEPKIADGGLGTCGKADVVNDPVHHGKVYQEGNDLHGGLHQAFGDAFF
jgi:hypothetical protein